MVFLRTACLRQAKPQLNLNWEITFGPRDVPLSTETNLSPHICRNHVHLWIIHNRFSILPWQSGVHLTLSCWSAGLAVALKRRRNTSPEIAGCCLMLQREEGDKSLITGRITYKHQVFNSDKMLARFIKNQWHKEDQTSANKIKHYCVQWTSFNLQTRIKQRIKVKKCVNSNVSVGVFCMNSMIG